MAGLTIARGSFQKELERVERTLSKESLNAYQKWHEKNLKVCGVSV